MMKYQRLAATARMTLCLFLATMPQPASANKLHDPATPQGWRESPGERLASEP
jgi:hypothetical protein